LTLPFLLLLDGEPTGAAAGQHPKVHDADGAGAQGDFSQTLDAGGKLIVIKDPLTGTSFPGNVIPADRLDANGLALISMLPGPATFPSV